MNWVILFYVVTYLHFRLNSIWKDAKGVIIIIVSLKDVIVIYVVQYSHFRLKGPSFNIVFLRKGRQWAQYGSSRPLIHLFLFVYKKIWNFLLWFISSSLIKNEISYVQKSVWKWWAENLRRGMAPLLTPLLFIALSIRLSILQFVI